MTIIMLANLKLNCNFMVITSVILTFTQKPPYGQKGIFNCPEK